MQVIQHRIKDLVLIFAVCYFAIISILHFLHICINILSLIYCSLSSESLRRLHLFYQYKLPEQYNVGHVLIPGCHLSRMYGRNADDMDCLPALNPASEGCHHMYLVILPNLKLELPQNDKQGNFKPQSSIYPLVKSLNVRNTE